MSSRHQFEGNLKKKSGKMEEIKGRKEKYRSKILLQRRED